MMDCARITQWNNVEYIVFKPEKVEKKSPIWRNRVGGDNIKIEVR
jgi:hypothetical protein